MFSLPVTVLTVDVSANQLDQLILSPANKKQAVRDSLNSYKCSFFRFLCDMIDYLTYYTHNNNPAYISPNREWNFKRLHIIIYEV